MSLLQFNEMKVERIPVPSIGRPSPTLPWDLLQTRLTNPRVRLTDQPVTMFVLDMTSCVDLVLVLYQFKENEPKSRSLNYIVSERG